MSGVVVRVSVFDDTAPDGLLQSLPCGVVAGAHDPRHIPQRGSLEPTLSEWPCRFAFEVVECDVMAGGQDLSEVEIAMDANPRHLHEVARQPGEVVHDDLFTGKYFGSEVVGGTTEGRPAQTANGFARLTAQR